MISKKNKISFFIDEEQEWLSLTPAQRIIESTKLWKLYLSLEVILTQNPILKVIFTFQKFEVKKHKEIKKGNRIIKT